MNTVYVNMTGKSVYQLLGNASFPIREAAWKRLAVAELCAQIVEVAMQR
jgi:hypothetical protein